MCSLPWSGTGREPVRTRPQGAEIEARALISDRPTPFRAVRLLPFLPITTRLPSGTRQEAGRAFATAGLIDPRCFADPGYDKENDMRHSRILAMAAFAAVAVLALMALGAVRSQAGEVSEGSWGAIEIGGLCVLAASAVGAAYVGGRRTAKQKGAEFLGTDCYVRATGLNSTVNANPNEGSSNAPRPEKTHENSDLTTRLAMAS